MSEQERADLLARDIDRLLSGEHVEGGDPLLDVARNLKQLPLNPSDAAAVRFESQLQRWFGSPTAGPARIVPGQVVLIAAVVAVLIALAGGILLLPNRQNNSATALPTMAATDTPTSTLTTTPTASPEPAATEAATVEATDAATEAVTDAATANATDNATTTFTRIIISGTIDSIQSTSIVVLGQPILLDKIPAALCVGDVVRIEAEVDENNVVHADHSAINVSTSACKNLPSGPQQSNPPSRGGKGGDNDHHHED